MSHRWDLCLETDAQAQHFGFDLGGLLRAGDLVVLTGPLGAGKTTLTRGIARACGVTGAIQSPTFVLARSYEVPGRPSFVHADAYRLTGVEDLDTVDIDFDHDITVMEWGEDFASEIADRWLHLTLEIEPGESFSGDEVRDVPRRAQLTAVGDGWDLESLTEVCNAYSGA